jgi:hypothetical protein
MKSIRINGKDYSIKYTIRALFIWEQITKRKFEITTLLDNYLFFYSMILANNPDNVLNWDDFIDALDSDPTLYKRISDVVSEQDSKNQIFKDENEKPKKDKKKA